MAKGRKLTTSRSERLFGSYSYGVDQRAVSEDSELGEEEVWSMVDDMVNGDDYSTNGSQGEWNTRAAAAESNGFRRVHPNDRYAGGLSLAFDDSGNTASSKVVRQFHGQHSASTPRGRQVAGSAPVDVPDWTKVYRVGSVESMVDSDADAVDDLEMVPPHEYLARSQRMATRSVFEGVGRTLKGRDLSRVRDAVWSQTGFDG